MQDPKYFKDIICKILNEGFDDDDIPAPPSRKDIKKQQFLRYMHNKNPDKRIWEAFINRVIFWDDNEDIWFDIETADVDISFKYELDGGKIHIQLPHIVVKQEELAPSLTVDSYWKSWVENDFMQWIAKEIKKTYNVISTFKVVEWVIDDEIVVSCPEFIKYLEHQLDGSQILLDTFTMKEALPIIEHWLKSTKK
jgi:hypothetical protein